MIFYAVSGQPVCLGFVGENEVEAVVFDKSAWLTEYGPGTFELVHKRRQDTDPLPVAVDVDGGVITWTLTESDTAYRGRGECQLSFYTPDGKLKKSEIYTTQTARSLVSGEDVPSPLEGWVEEVLKAAAGIQNMQTDAETLVPGSAATVTKTVDPDTGVVTLTFGIPEGLKGDTGRGIASMSVLSTGEWRIIYTDGTSETVGYDVYSALDALKTAAQEAAETASGAAGTAVDAATNAATSAANAADSAEAAEDAEENAEREAERAEQGAADAQESATAAAGSASAANTAKTDAQAANTAAQGAKTDALNAKTAAESARDQAEAAASAYIAERHWFVAGRFLKADDTFTTGTRYAYSLAGIFRCDNGVIKIKSLNNVFDFSIVDRTAATSTAWADEQILTRGNYTVNLRKKDGTAIVGTDISDIEISVLGFDFYDHTHIKLSETKKILHYSDYVSGRQLISSGAQEGLGYYTTNRYNALKMAFYSDKNIDVWVGRSDTCIVDVFVDGLCVASISQGNKYTIQAHTNFVLGWHNTATSSVPNGSNILLVVEDADATLTTGIAQFFASPSQFNATPDVGCSFFVDDKIFSISDNGTYCVTQGETVVTQNVSLDVSAGHANSCNFYNGKAYVSDWDNPAIIHVYDVDSENNALTHSKDITLTVDAETGATEYFVFDNEKQIISLGWKTGNSGTNPNVLTYALWLLTTDGYVKAWERYAVRPKVLQSMTIQNGYIYYIECYGSSNSYKFIGVNRINIETGITEYTSLSPAGSILDYEGEGLIPIGNEVFLIVMNNGRVYMFAFV